MAFCTFAAEMGKSVVYRMPVDYISGNISGRQDLEYSQDGAKGYDVPDGAKTAATNYEPRLVAMHSDKTLRTRNYFQVRTRTSVNMTGRMRRSLAVMGGAGAIYAALVNNKSSLIYEQCVAAKPKDVPLRRFVVPALMTALAAKEYSALIADGVEIDNPWLEDNPNVPISDAILDKFNEVLGPNGRPPYDESDP